ncbi:hypothetical protein BJF85_11580 [Saccharomonospora sp. CUA-673]|uniref:toxin-antitoxin system YwqK family antitoxin n=1 Tax=Saccharomonospora sp. CUA-673 TaxID=1904969 RepID=UPI00096781C3|nr:hypothetical protein [Saccharomonospora sp. CUA-673]OLT48761.1 hypothetical protein BJF85_11580 [Saccharomonospora sp. CUA-673]
MSPDKLPRPLPETPDERDEQQRKQGLWTDRDARGGVMVGTYVDDLRHGEWKHYAHDGRLRSEGRFAQGELEGQWTWYRADEQLMQRGGFLHGEKHGTWERWNAQGRAIDRGDFEHGKKVGTWEQYNPDGTVKKTTRHRDPQHRDS